MRPTPSHWAVVLVLGLWNEDEGLRRVKLAPKMAWSVQGTAAAVDVECAVPCLPSRVRLQKEAQPATQRLASR